VETVTIDPGVVLVRLALALVFGTVIGVEREWRQKHAGLKTMALVALGAAAFGMMTDTFGPENHNPAQIAAAVVGGIGFIGAGVIMHRGITVQGVTTAATLWADASVGLAAGLGHYVLASALAVTVVLTQFVGRTLEAQLFSRRRLTLASRFEVRVECDAEALHTVNEMWKGLAGVTTVRRGIHHGPEFLVLRLTLRAPQTLDLTPIEERLINQPGIHGVDVRHLGLEED
jgi:putative Mg2+ transporter-C (MgtC) family protein